MDINTTDLTKLLELNQKGLISDEVLADALKERYLKDKIVEKTEEEKRQELIEKNRERTNSIREKWLEKAKEEEYQKKNEINNDKQDKEIQEMKDDLALEKNNAGEFVYSRQYLDGLSYLELMTLFHNIKENKSEKSINVKYDYIDSLKFINIIKKKGTICLALAKDEDDENVYVVYQNKYNIIGFDRIDPKAFGYNISEAEKEYEERVKKEEKELATLYDEETMEETKTTTSKQGETMEAGNNNSFIDTSYIFEVPNEMKNTGFPLSPIFPKETMEETKPTTSKQGETMEAENNNPFIDTSYIFEAPKIKTMEETKSITSEQEKSSRVIGDINNLGEEDSELGNLNEKAEKVTKAETDTKFEPVNANPERMEKLKNSKKSAFVKGLKIVGLVAAGSLLLSTGFAGVVAGVFSYNHFAKKIREGSWEPKNDIEKFMKYSIEKIMDLRSDEGKVR